MAGIAMVKKDAWECAAVVKTEHWDDAIPGWLWANVEGEGQWRIFGPYYGSATVATIQFKREKDAVLFALRWC
jgi:hypothetical protein